MASVQFRGIANVLKAYNYKEVDIWAIFEGKRLQHKGTGETELTEYLNLLSLGGSNATLILKIYEDITDPRQIKSNTADDGSFSFKILDIDDDPDFIYRSNRPQSMGRVGEILTRIDERLTVIENGGGADDEPGLGKAVQNAIIGAIEDPQKLGAFLGIIREIFSPGSVSKPIAALGNVTRMKVETEPATETGNNNEQMENAKLYEDQIKRLGAAIDTLSDADPNLVAHLEKLAALSKSDPKKFQGLISMIDFL